MTKKTRLIILLICVACFLLIAPVLVFYSMGYRLDFEKMIVTSTGGIYVRTFPSADQITIDSKTSDKPGIFSNSIFMQSLLPDNHTVLIQKTGYFDYFKTLPVLEKEVTKLENVLLIKKIIAFSDIAEKISYFSIAPDNKNILTVVPDAKSLALQYYPLALPAQKKTFLLALQGAKVLDVKWTNDSNKALIKIQILNTISYYTFDNSKAIQQATPLLYLDKNSQQVNFNPQNLQELFYIENKTLYSLKNSKVTSVIKNIVTYKFSNNTILWLSSDGFLLSSDISKLTAPASEKTATSNAKLIEEITSKSIDVLADNSYEIVVISGQTFLKENNALLAYNSVTKSFDDFKITIDNLNVLSSPDGQNMVYYNNKDIYLYSFLKNSPQNNVKIFSANSPEIISNCFWLNNDYLIFESGNKITISEIDYRGNINAVELPQNYGKSPDSKNPQIYFNPQNSKVYVLNGDILYSSEKLTP